jgi:hypothetical protein
MKHVLYSFFFFLAFTGMVRGFDYLPTPDLARGSETGYCSPASALENNPSFLALLDNTLISAGYVSFYNPSFFYSFNLSFQNRITHEGTVGFLWSRLSVNSGVKLFDYREDSLFAGYGHRLFPFLILGGHLHLLNINTDVSTACAYSASVSLMFHWKEKYFLSFMFHDLFSTKLKWNTGLEEDYPRSMIIGLGLKNNFGPVRIVFGLDYLVPDLKILDYTISSTSGLTSFRTGLTLEYGPLSVSGGIRTEDGIRLTTGMNVKIIHDILLGFAYIHEPSDLGSSAAVFIQYENKGSHDEK